VRDAAGIRQRLYIDGGERVAPMPETLPLTDRKVVEGRKAGPCIHLYVTFERVDLLPLPSVRDCVF
jgi:hypothetical protein